jgi:hypothetical protein
VNIRAAKEAGKKGEKLKWPEVRKQNPGVRSQKP